MQEEGNGKLIWDGVICKTCCMRTIGRPNKINKAIETTRRRMLKINLDLRMSVFKAKIQTFPVVLLPPILSN
jgi:hypothetical protein